MFCTRKHRIMGTMEIKIKKGANTQGERAKPATKLKTKIADERTHAALPNMSGLKSKIETLLSTASESGSAISAGTLPPHLFSQYHIFCCLTPDFRASSDCEPAIDIAFCNAFIGAIITNVFVFVNKHFCSDIYKLFCDNK